MTCTITVAGFVGTEPELKDIGDSQVASFSMAVNQYFGEREPDHTTWFTVDVWGQRAKFVCEHFNVGKPVFVAGRLKADDVTNENGMQRTFLTIKASQVEFVPSKKSDNADTSTKTKAEPVKQDEIPF